MSIASEALVKFRLAPAFHFTLIDNLHEILQAGCLFSKTTVGHRLNTDLSNPEIQKARDNTVIPATGRRVTEYVPLYFGFKTPMLSLKRKQNEDIIYLRFTLDILGISGAVFSDVDASDRDTKFFAFQKVDDLAVLDHATINGAKWGTDLDKKRRKQSEILIPDSLTLSYLVDIFCYSESSRIRTQNVLNSFTNGLKAVVKPGFYFSENTP